MKLLLLIGVVLLAGVSYAAGAQQPVPMQGLDLPAAAALAFLTLFSILGYGALWQRRQQALAGHPLPKTAPAVVLRPGPLRLSAASW
ncbi:MAG TPA: hypothetical protein VLI06_12585 [Solimonas sp.]|nr:hypothetical protein [Solimonas sp.]